MVGTMEILTDHKVVTIIGDPQVSTANGDCG